MLKVFGVPGPTVYMHDGLDLGSLNPAAIHILECTWWSSVFSFVNIDQSLAPSTNGAIYCAKMTCTCKLSFSKVLEIFRRAVAPHLANVL